MFHLMHVQLALGLEEDVQDQSSGMVYLENLTYLYEELAGYHVGQVGQQHCLVLLEYLGIEYPHKVLYKSMCESS